ncbi:Serine/threonine-protein kinase tor, partial [Geodia barretti]
MGTPLSKPMDKTTPDVTAVGDQPVPAWSPCVWSQSGGFLLPLNCHQLPHENTQRPVLSLSTPHHAIQALGSYSKSGIKSVPYLPQVMPPFLHALCSCISTCGSTCSSSSPRSSQSSNNNARDYIRTSSSSFIREFWTTEHQHLQNTIILLIEKIVAGMGDELKIYIPRMVEPVLKLFLQDQSKMKISTQKMLAALQLCGASLDDYLHLLIPPIVKVFETDTNPTDVRRTALETIEKLSQTVNFSDYASQIIHSIVVVLDTSSELRPVAMDALCSLMTQLGQRYKIFIPMVKKVMTKNKYNYTNYELLLVRLLRDEPLSPEDDVDRQLKAGKSKSVEDDSAEIEAASFKKFPLEPNALTRAWSSVGRVSKEDWVEWLRRLGVELLKESPSPSLRSCWALAQAYNALARELFNAAFVSCWMELRRPTGHDLRQALTHQTIPEITQTILNLAEFMEHCEEATQKVQEKWYMSLNDWEAAYKAYTERQKQRPDDISLTLGKMRCLHAMGEWTRLYEMACESWGLGDDTTRQKMSVMASAAAWGLGQWESMEEYVRSIPKHTMEGSFYQALLHIHQKEFDDAQKCIDLSRDILVTELTTLATESYSRAYGVMVSIQLLSELEETVLCLMQSDRKTQLQQTWWNRLLGCQRNTEDWQRILQVRSIVLSQQEEIQSWVKFASICRRSDKMALSERTLRSILSHDPAYSTEEPLSDKYPSVTFAFVKHLWQTGERDRAFDFLSKFVRTLQPLTPATQNTQDTRLLARCYQKLGDWRLQLEERGGSVPSIGPAITAILQHYHRATEYNRSSYKAWHAWAFMNLQALLEHKKPSSGKAAVYSTPGEIGRSSSNDQQTTPTSESRDLHAPPTETKLITYACSAVHGFFRSISLSQQSSLQDTLRLLTLWFDYGHYPDVHDAVTDGLKTIDIDTWLQVIPQLIARIDHPRRLVAKLIHDLLTDVGKQHPQALIYPLTVASKSQSPMRRAAADTILQNMTEHSSRLVQQAILVSEELIRVAILWHEQWHEGLEDASRMYFGEHNVKAMFSILEPLHHRMERGPETLKEISFNHAYGRDLAEAYEWCKKYQSTANVKELTQAWELYYHVFRKISKQLPQLTTLELQYVSPKLMGCVDLELAVPGTYEPNQPVVHIRKVSATLNVITSKQRPRKLVIQGSNGRDYMFLLKGHEDLRQDERVMQLFGLVNTLLGNDPETFKRHLSIERYSVIPLSPNSGLIGWVPHCDTIHSLIRDYREKKKIMLNIEHRLMLQ